jgi:glycosyltransferase involved in cell wall biosynthesis
MKYSFLVPVYNVKNYLEQCVDSMLSQTYRNFEIILVDDGSNDGSETICDRYQEKYPEYVKVIHQKNGGLVCARQTGIENANGLYCVFVDSDDFVEPKLLEEIDKVFSKNDNIDMVIYSFCYYAHGKKTHRKSVLSETEVFFEGENKKELYEALMYSTKITSLWTKAVKTEILKNDTVSYKEYYQNSMGEDWFRSISLLTDAKRIGYINLPLYNYRIDNIGMTRVFSLQSIEKKNMMFIYQRLLSVLPLWNMDNKQTVNRLKARWLDEVVYSFSLYYMAAKTRSDKRAVVGFDWSSMLPDGTPNSDNPFESDGNRKIFQLIQNREYGKINLIYKKRKFNQIYKKIKARFKHEKKK